MLKKFFRSFLRFNRQVDHVLLGICLICSALSLMLLYGIHLAGFVTIRVLQVQALTIVMGVLVAIIVSIVDYRFIIKLWRYFYPMTIGLIFLTYFIGIQRASYIDDKAWLKIPFIDLTFQPSEVLKLAFILTLALHLTKVKDAINSPQTLLGVAGHTGFITLLIILQGDAGTAMVFVAIAICMIFAAGLSYKYILACLGSLIPIAPLVWFFFLDDNKRDRIMIIFKPELDPTGTGVGYQQLLGVTSIGSGQIWGKGLFREDVQYIPEMHNDFIFSYIGETFGFIGSLVILVLIGILCMSILLNAKRAEDSEGRFICIGVFAIILFQSFWGIGMCLSLLPVAGLTLPFFSAGGTSVVMTYAAIGLVLNVHRHSYINIFSKT